jgi:hypothetical protein
MCLLNKDYSAYTNAVIADDTTSIEMHCFRFSPLVNDRSIREIGRWVDEHEIFE